MNIYIYLGIVFLQMFLTLPNFLKTCNDVDYQKLFIFLSHHFLDVYLFFSIFFLYKRRDFIIHLFLAIVISIHWFNNNNSCVLTVQMNKLCNYEDNHPLDSLKNRLGLQTLSENFHYYWIGITMLYDIYMIMK